MTDDNAPGNTVVIERTFDAPRELVWQMWTDPEHFRAWYGPDGVEVPVARMEVRVGGARLVGMTRDMNGQAMQMWFTGEYREVVENARLVYTESMSDEHGTVLSAAESGMPEGHPTTTEVTVELEDLGDGTRLVLTHAGIPQDSPGAVGWNMALDKLATRVAAQLAR
jgi:uncharacterized protein YndB with AHSA1/START domain